MMSKMSNAKLDYMWKFLKDNKYSDDNAITGDIMCIICKNILVNPCSARCGCRYCLECVTNYLSGTTKYCPGNMDDCKEELLDINNISYFDHPTTQKISKLIVKCPRDTCEFKCELRKMKEHEKQCRQGSEGCPYVSVNCENKNLTQGKIKEHLVEENESHAKLLMECIDFLQTEMKSTKRLLTDLQSELREVKQDWETKLRVVEEQYRKMESMATEIESLKRKNTIMNKENKSLRTEIKRYQNERLESLADSKKVEIQKREMYRMKRKYQMNGDQPDESEQANKRRDVKSIENGVETESKSVENHQTDLDALPDPAPVPSSSDTGFDWNIENWSIMKRSAETELFSDVFLSHLYGYKMCLSIDFAEDGQSSDSYLWVNVHLLPGPFDDSLQWPFKHTICVALINQVTGLVHASRISIADQLAVNWAGPTDKRIRGFGFQLMRLADLSANVALRKNDRITIRCTVL